MILVEWLINCIVIEKQNNTNLLQQVLQPTAHLPIKALILFEILFKTLLQE